jgi:sugar phosphate permease
VAGIWMRDPAPEPAGAGAAGEVHPLRDPAAWRLAAVSFALVVPQLSLLSFVALYLHDERGLTPVAAGAVLAAVQVAGAVARIVAGTVSDRRGSRLRPLRWVAVAVGVALLAGVALLRAPIAVTVAGLALAGVLTLSWNGLAFLAAAEAAPARSRGAALGLQNTAVTLAAALAPAGFGLAVALAGWTVAFALLLAAPVAALVLLGPLLRSTVPA